MKLVVTDSDDPRLADYVRLREVSLRRHLEAEQGLFIAEGAKVIRRAIETRDVHCVFAGCTAPAAWCDVHHVVHWAFGGPTSCENGALLCERHHTAVHEGGFSIARDPGTAVWHTYRADGSEVRIRGPAP